jgi:hypothetical protein
MTMSIIPFLAIGFFVLVLFLVIRMARRQMERSDQIRQRLGFTKVEPVDPALVERLSALLETKCGRVRVSRIYKRDHGSYALYDCRVRHGHNSDSNDECSVLVGRGWQLPSLKLAPQFGGEGKAWGWLNRLALMAIKEGGFEQVVLSDQPEFAKKYVALSRTPQDVARQVPSEVWRELAALPAQLFLQAQGDTIMFSDIDTLTRRTPKDRETAETEALRQSIDYAARLNSIFERCRTGFVDESVMRTVEQASR